MNNYDYPRLCGGTFFVLLLQARKQRSRVRNRFSSGNDGLSDSDMLIELIRVAQPQYQTQSTSTFRQNTSAYKSCQVSNGTYLPFQDAAIVDGFDRQVRSNYTEALAAMSLFVDRFIDTENAERCTRLVRALLELIEKDQSISETSPFYRGNEIAPVTKTILSKATKISIDRFLLSIWHFIITQRPDNTIGRITFEQWHMKPKESGQQWKFISDIGAGLSRSVTVPKMETVNTAQHAPDKNDPQLSSKLAPSTAARNVEPTSVNKASHVADNMIPSDAPATNHTAEGKLKVNLDYYNLFVVRNETFSGRHFVLPKHQVLNQYMMQEVKDQFSNLSEEAVAQIKTLPSIFSCENHMFMDLRKDRSVFLGFVTGLSVQDNGLRISFRRLSSIPQERFKGLQYELGIYTYKDFYKDDSEMRHTHWSIKKIDLLDVLEVAGIDVSNLYDL